MAALPPVVEIDVPREALYLKYVHALLPGNRSQTEPNFAGVEFLYSDGSSAQVDEVGVPGDCYLTGYHEVGGCLYKAQGYLGEVCCGGWYYARFTNPNPDQEVTAVVPAVTGLSGMGFTGFIWALTLERMSQDSCAGHCGDYSEDFPCQCDNECFAFGDCCEDICDICAETVDYGSDCD